MRKPRKRKRIGRKSREKQSGFALIVTVSLLALLVLVLVALASLTRIESSIGRNSLHFAQARQNALFALDVAIGELQLHAGPDSRVTGRADLEDENHPNANWTAIWNTDGTLRTWLVSGNENVLSTPDFEPDDLIGSLSETSTALADNITIDDEPARLLVGSNTVGGANDVDYVVAPTVELLGPAPGGAGDVVQGRYAWWVGDEGIKASLALEDRLDDIDYGPYGIEENRMRLRQQVPLTHQTFRGAGGSAGAALGFDPAAVPNPEGIQNIITRSQLRYLTPTGGTFATFLRNRFHDATTVSYGVLANTRTDDYRGLKRDLSIDPALLGPGFAAWANYSSYMEDPSAPNTSVPPIDSPEDLRRRYHMTGRTGVDPAVGEIVHSVAPVLSEFIVQFGFRRTAMDVIQMHARVHVGLWNPYTSALVIDPDFGPLELRISGLPSVEVFVEGDAGVSTVVSLQEVFNGFVLNLPFNTNSTMDPIPGSLTNSDRWSWLPGRVVNWRTPSNAVADGPNMTLFANSMGGTVGWVTDIVGLPFTASGRLVVRKINGAPANVVATIGLPDGSNDYSYSGEDVAADWTDWVVIPPNPDDDSNAASDSRWGLGFGFRLKQPAVGFVGDSWLKTAGFDPRNTSIAGNLMLAHDLDAGLDPAEYDGAVAIDNANFQLNRPTSTSGGVGPYSFDHDTPIFELPRMPILSLGMLQHLHVQSEPPFSIGNSWGSSLTVPGAVGGGSIGSWFDRYFFSGITPYPFTADGEEDDEWDPGKPLPNFHLRIYDPGNSFDLNAFRISPDSYWSQNLLMAGAFNVNSVSIDAWEAVLRSLRPGAPDAWNVSELEASTGTVAAAGNAFPADTSDSTQAASTISAQGSGFFRFSQSAQETYETTGPAGGFDRTRFRQGFRGGSSGIGQLSSTQIRALAREIVDLIRVEGPILSMEQFVSPTSSGISILEQAIYNADHPEPSDPDPPANINSPFPESCSLLLTQADILTAIGPMLQNRSDTFVVRTYGEAVNPVTGNTEGRAWCEATVQRVPTFVNSAQSPDTVFVLLNAPNSLFGRRFQIISFRWLTPEDI